MLEVFFPSMRKLLLLIPVMLSAHALAAEHTIAVVGLVHSHVWGHLGKMIQGNPARLVGVAETAPELVAEAEKRGVAKELFHSDWRKMIDAVKPEIVWAFVENNRHLEIVQYCAPRKIHVIFEKPLASTYRDSVTIRDLARKHGIHVLCNYQMAWWPTSHAVREAAAAGQIGDVWRLRGIVGHGGPGGPKGLNKYFFEWLTDPVKNGAGALVDFGCYNALWSLMYLGRPSTVYAVSHRLRPDEFPKVEDTALLVLSYPKGVALLEASWDLPRSFQDLELFGRKGSLYMTSRSVELRQGRETREIPAQALPPEKAEPIAYMIHCIESKTEPEGMTSLDLNVGVMEIIDAAKESIRTGRAVALK